MNFYRSCLNNIALKIVAKSIKYVWQLTGFISSKYFYLHCNLFRYLLTNLFIYSFTFCCVLMLLICCQKKEKKSSSRLTHFANNLTFQWTSLFSRPGKIYGNLYHSTAQNLCTQIKGSLLCPKKMTTKESQKTVVGYYFMHYTADYTTCLSKWLQNH